MAKPVSLHEKLAAAVVAGASVNLLEDSDRAGKTILSEGAMQSWGPEREISAGHLADLVRGFALPNNSTAHPRGVELRGARIRGRLMLDFSDTLPLRLLDCLLDEGLNIRSARLPQLMLIRCRIANQSLSPLSAEGAHIDGDLSLAGSVVTASKGAQFAVDLRHAHIGRDMIANEATVENESGTALNADLIEVGGTLLLQHLAARGADAGGAVRVSGGRITGQLDADSSSIENKSGCALFLDRLEVGASLRLGDEFTATSVSDLATVRLFGARIAGQLVVDRAQFTNEAGPALNADFCTIGGDALFDDDFHARGDTREEGVVRLTNARVSGKLAFTSATLLNVSGPALDASGLHTFQLDLDAGFNARGAGDDASVCLTGARISDDLLATDARLTNESGPALNADQVEVGGNISIDGEFTAYGTDTDGAVSLLGARVTGDLLASGARLTNESGPALNADQVEVGRSLVLTQGFTARGVGDSGTVRLIGARIAGALTASQAALINESGPALSADRCTIDAGLFLNDGFNATGDGAAAAVQLLDARVNNGLSATGANIVNESGPALDAARCSISGGVYLNDGFTARGAGRLAAVRLNDARVTGQLSARGALITSTSAGALSLAGTEVTGSIYLDGGFSARGGGSTTTVVDLSHLRAGPLWLDARVTNTLESKFRWTLDGCSYRGLPRPDNLNRWLTLLSDATPDYAAQPYQQLAAVYREAGHDRHVRSILMAQRRDQIHRGDLSRREIIWARFTGLVLGYGWQPWRALYGLASVLAVSVLLAVVLGEFGALTTPPRTDLRDAPGMATAAVAGDRGACSIVERVGVGLDLGTPLLGTATKSRDRCPIAATGSTATALILSTWVLQFLAWAFGALFIAGFTSAVRKT